MVASVHSSLYRRTRRKYQGQMRLSGGRHVRCERPSVDTNSAVGAAAALTLKFTQHFHLVAGVAVGAVGLRAGIEAAAQPDTARIMPRRVRERQRSIVRVRISVVALAVVGVWDHRRRP